SFPVALGQCRRFLQRELGEFEEIAAKSTSDAAKVLADEQEPATAAISSAMAAKLYGLEILATDIEDHPENETRFVLVGPPGAGVPGPTGHDRTSIACFQRRDQPGSLHAILGQ